ncbi:MAG: hypothetical protein DKINENOH_00535 [bacterium]|nr:hypothetical protein [bacterium]
MDQAVVMEKMKAYFAKSQPAEVVNTLGEQVVTRLLQDSLDVVEFLVYLEEELQLASEIDLNSLGPQVVNRTFAEIAGAIVAHVQTRQPGPA